MKSPLHILYLEDDPGDVRLVRDVLRDDGLCEELIAVDNREGFLAALEQGPDLILADYALPTFDGLEALDLCRARCPLRPFIFVTGALGEERAIETLKRGATDYVMKSRLSRLALAVRRAISEAEAHIQRQEAEEQIRRHVEELRESEEKFRNAFINAAIGFAMVTLDGHFVDTNAAYCQLIGYDLETLKTLTNWQLIHPDDLAENMGLIDQMLSGQIINFVVENRYFHKNGKIVWVRKSVSLVRNTEGSPQWIITLVEDITERKRIEEALREADRRKDEFLAILGHELRNPLAVISSAIKLLNRSHLEVQKETFYKRLIEEQIQQINRIISDLLDISRIARGKIKLEMQEVRVVEVVNKSLETVQKSYAELGHHLLVDCSSEPMVVLGDPARLQQILVNLLSNAGKYTPSGGSIHLVVEPEEGEVVLRVSDNGIGIPHEVQMHIFEMFTQVESSRQRSQGGLGIGLSLVKMLTDIHGGSISVHSEGEGYGSEFVVRLPLIRSESVPLTPVEPLPYEEVAGLQVLVVDDNIALAHMLADAIEEQGHIVQHAHDGLEALAMASQQRPDVVLLDIGLPKLDGYEVAQRLRNELNLKETLTIATTAWGQERDRQRSAEAGIDHHLVKPVDYSKIAPLISQWYLNRQKVASASDDVLSPNLH